MRPGILASLWLVAVAVAPATTARAGDAPPATVPGPVAPAPTAPAGVPIARRPTPEAEAEGVLAARAAKDDAALRALAMRDDPDPWLVTDALVARGKSAAAEAFALAAPRKDTEALPAYLAGRAGKPLDRVAREALDAAIAAHGEGNEPRALAILAGPQTTGDAVAAVRWAHVKGLALRGVRRFTESADAFMAASAQAKTLGWLARADRSLNEAGTSAMAATEWTRALAAWDERVTVAKARDDRASVAVSLGKMSSIHALLSDYPRALELEEQALALQKALGDREETAASLARIGGIRKSLGDFTQALAAEEQALALRRELGDRAGIARALASIGDLQTSLGDYPRALDLEEQALKLFEELGDRVGTAQTLGAIGNIRHFVGDCRAAIEIQGQALKLMEDLGDSAQAATTLGTIGAIHCSIQDFPRALEIQERALALKEGLGDRPGIASSLENIGLIQRSMGELPKALATYQRALKLREELGDRAGVAAVLGSIGLIHETMEDFKDALLAQERALVMAERLGAQELILERLWGLSRTHLANGDPAQAVELAHRGVDVLGRLASGLAEEQGTKAREQFGEIFEIGAKAGSQLDDAAETAFFLESGRAATLLEALGGRDALRSFVIPDALRMEEAKARAEEAKAHDVHVATLERGIRAEIKVTKKALTDAQTKVAEVIERIQRQAKAAASVVYPKADSLEVIQRRLGPGDTLVWFGLYSDAALALVATAKDARIVALGRAAPIVDACKAENWAEVRALAIEPLGLGKDVRRLIVSPMGALASAPFCVLAPEHEIVYVPSATTYGVLLDESRKQGVQVLALGDPDYAPQAGATAGAGGALIRGNRTLAPLPATRDEANAVGNLVLLGPDATESSLRKELLVPARWHSVHLACHGIVNHDRPKLSSLALSHGDNLTMIEVFRLKIQSDLCVLSACDTARGKVYSTEGVEGFVRAFLFAGAPRVIVSLWKVDDLATLALMTKLYELWNPSSGKPGLPVATALREAQAYVRAQEKWKEPVFWAAWQLWGLPD